MLWEINLIKIFYLQVFAFEHFRFVFNMEDQTSGGAIISLSICMTFMSYDQIFKAKCNFSISLFLF